MANGSQGLLAEGNPLFDIGIGLLSAAGPQRFPVSTGQALAQGLLLAGDRNRFRLDNQLIRNRLSLQKQEERISDAELQNFERQKEARRKLFGLDIPQAGRGEGFGVLQSSGTEAPIRGLLSGQATPETLGLLSEIAPEQFASSLIQSTFPRATEETSLIQNVRALNDPSLSDDQKNLIRKSIESDPAANDTMLKLVDLSLKQLQIDQKQREIEQGDRSSAEERTALVSGITRDIKDARRMLELNSRLRDTFLESGVPLPEARRVVASGLDAVKRSFGMETIEAQKLINDFDEFQKTSIRFAAQAATELFSSGRITNFQFQSIRSATPSLSISPGANDRIIADQLRIILDGADAAKVEIKERAEIDALISSLRQEAPSFTTGVNPPPVRAEDFPGFSDLTTAEQAQFRRRLKASAR